MAFIGKITDSDGVTGLIGSALYGTCATEAATVAKVGTLSAFDTLMTGITIHIKFTYSNTATDPTLNVNGTGAKRIYKAGTTSVGTTVETSWLAGAVVALTYDGSAWIINDHTDDTDTKNTTGATDTSSKIYLVGATAQTANPQTYSDNEVFVTNGVLTTKKAQVGGGACTLEYNSGTESLDFVFT